MRIALAGPYPSGTKEKFQSILPEHTWTEVKTQEEYDALTEVDVIIVRVLKTPEKTLKNKKDLKVIIRWGAGFDSVDIETAGKQQVLVATTPGVNSYAVAELAVAMMLAIGRKVIENNEKTHEGIWDNKIYADQMTTLNHKTVGVIGGGNIGRSVAKRVQAFGANVVYYDVFRLSEEQEKDCNMQYLPLEELLKAADVISLHVPLLDSTRHMIGEKELELMKDHVIIVNTARGGLIDDAALEKALKSGKVLGAGLDCTENEDMTENPLAAMDNVILTPHMGGTSNDLPDEMIPRIADQLKLYVEKGTVNYVVNREYLQMDPVKGAGKND